MIIYLEGVAVRFSLYSHSYPHTQLSRRAVKRYINPLLENNTLSMTVERTKKKRGIERKRWDGKHARLVFVVLI